MYCRKTRTLNLLGGISLDFIEKNWVENYSWWYTGRLRRGCGPRAGQSVSSVPRSCPILCDPMDCSMPGFPVHHQLECIGDMNNFWLPSALRATLAPLIGDGKNILWKHFWTSGIFFPLWLSWLRVCLQCGRPGFNPWVGKIPWRRERLLIPVFWPREFHGLYSPCGLKELDMTEQLSISIW